VLYSGLSTLGSGATLGGLILAAIAVFMIEREFFKAAGFAVAGGVLTFFGLMHSEQIGFGQSPLLAIAYLCVGGLLLCCTKLSTVPMPQHADAAHDEDLEEAAGQSV